MEEELKKKIIIIKNTKIESKHHYTKNFQDQVNTFL